jgi:sigma-B regulation protein RsbU (phosphoserine phosphatase)
VSGDLYRFEQREGDEACLVFVADVSGKGMAASLLTASLEALAAGPMEMGRPPDEFFNKLSRRLHHRTPAEKFATAFVASLTANQNEVSYANAGHNPALVVRSSGEVDELGATGVPLGLLSDATFTRAETTLEDGDTLVVYTHGITEALDPEGQEHGLDRLKGVCCRERLAPVDRMAEAIEKDLESFARGTP